MVCFRPPALRIIQGIGDRMKSSTLIVLILILLCTPVMAATNSFTSTLTTTSQLSNGAYSSGCTISNDNVYYSTSGVGGFYVSPEFYAPNITSAAITYSAPYPYTTAYGWFNEDDYTDGWLNSSDVRTSTVSNVGIRYNFAQGAGTTDTLADIWFTGSSDIENGELYGDAYVAGTLNNPSTYAVFDGNDDYARTTYNFNYEGTWQIAAMIYPTGSSGSPIGISSTTTNAGMELQYIDAANDFLNLYIYDSNGVSVSCFNSSKTISPNTWHYIYISCDGTTVRLYCDGVLQSSGNINVGSGNLILNTIQLGGVYIWSTNTADWAGRMDEFRFMGGGGEYATNALPSSLLGSYMWNEINSPTSNNPRNNYQLSHSGGSIKMSGFGYSYSTNSVYLSDTSITFDNTKPTYSTISPINGEVADNPTLSVTAHDADTTYLPTISAEFYIDGESVGTNSRSGDGAITKSTTVTGGYHEWYAVVYDPWSGSVLTSTYNFSVPNTLYIRDEAAPDSLIDDAEVHVSFYTQSSSVTRTSNNGTIDLTGLPTTDMLVTATADGYISRKTIIFSLYDTANIYLVNESADVIYQKFVLNTQTISGSPTGYILKIQKPMNGTVNTVFSSLFDFDGGCGTYLIGSDVYQLVIVAPDGTESEYGYLYPDPDGQIDIAYQGITFNEYVNAWLSTNTTIDRDAMSIAYAYEEAAQEDSLNPISVTEATVVITDADGNTVYNVSVTDNSYVFQYSAAADGRYNVNIEILGEDGEGNEFSYTKSFVVDFIDDHFQFMPDAYPDWLKMLIVTFLCLFVLIAFGGYRSDLAAGLSFGLYAFSAYQEWISVGSLALGVLFIIVMAAFFKLQRNIKRTGYP